MFRSQSPGVDATQVIKAVLKDAEDDTRLSLLYANQTPDDILLFEELQEMAKDPRLSVWYTGALSLFRPLQMHRTHGEQAEMSSKRYSAVVVRSRKPNCQAVKMHLAHIEICLQVHKERQ